MKFMGVVFLSVMCLCAAADTLSAQETINYGTISGRVTDPQGAVVPGASVIARQSETNLTRDTVTDREGRFRFPYLRLGHYDITIRMPGFAETTRSVTRDGRVGVRASDHARGGRPRSQRRRHRQKSTVLEAARSQIAGTVSQAEVQSLPMNGRNFLDLALLVPGVSPTNIGSTQLFAETSAVPGQGLSIGSQRNFSNNFIVDGLSANDDAAGLSGIPYGVDAVDQFQVVTSGGQAELGRALGGYISVVTKSGTNTAARRRVRVFPRRQPERDECAARIRAEEAADEPEAVRRAASADRSRATGRSTSRTSSSAGSTRPGSTTISQANVAVINARLQAVGVSGLAGLDRHLSESGRHDALSREGGSSVQQPRSVQRPVHPLRRAVAELARRRRAERAERVVGPRQHRSVDCVQQHADAVVDRTVNETRVQFAVQRSQGAAERSDRTGRQHRRRRVVRNAVGEPAGTAEHDVSDSSTTCRTRLARMRCARASTSSTTTTRSRSRERFAAPTRSRRSRNFLSGTYNTSGFTQTFGETVVSQTNPERRRLRAGRVESQLRR